MAEIRQYIELEMDIKPIKGLTEDSFRKNIATWRGETEIEFAEYCTENNGDTVFGVVCGFYIDTDYEAWSEDPDGMGWGRINYFEIDDGWYEQSEAEKEVLDFIAAFGYEVICCHTLNFDENCDEY